MPVNKAKILDLLHASGGSVPWCRVLESMDEAAAQRALSEMERDGCEPVRENGVLRLARGTNVLRPEYLAPYLEQAVTIEWLPSVDSTNEEAKRAALAGKSAPRVFLAEVQTAGKGRLGRVWEGGHNQSVQMSLLYRPERIKDASAGLSFAAALGVCRAVVKTCGLEPKIKWPNDVVLGTRKICGILIETALCGERMQYAVAGTGVNVSQESFDGELSERATSLSMASGYPVDRAQVAAEMVNECIRCTEQFMVGGLDALMDEYRARSVVLGRDVSVVIETGNVHGKCTGFGRAGQIEVRTPDGRTLEFMANDVSVRGMTDYV